MTKNEFIMECEKLGILLNDEMVRKFDKYKDLLIEWNEKINLTSIIKEEDIYLKHFYDSLCLVKAVDLNEKLKLCDFGTGAGFPGVVLAIVFNNLEVTLIESNGKKITFLNKLKEELKLNNISIINDRVEDYAKKNRELYDIVTCRAVSNLGIICELSVSLPKINGIFVPLKSNIGEEVSKYNHYINELGYKLKTTINYTLPIENSSRCIPVFVKIKKTDLKFPNSYNVIIKKYK